jgi:membrane fusion protein, multidrug efflux system
MIRNTLTLVCAAALSLALAAMNGCNRGAGAAGFEMPPPVVTTAPVSIEDVPVYLDEIGKSTPFESVNITPQVSGQIIARKFQDGSDITKGQILFLIAKTPFQATLDQTIATLQQDQAQLSNAQTNFQRVASELPSRAVSQQDYDNAKSAVDVAVANVKAAQAQIEAAKWNLDNCTIASPIDGRAGQRLVDVGNVVNANSTNLLNIQRLMPIYVDFTVPENELDRVRANLANGPLKVLVSTPDNPTKPVDGEVTFLDNSVQDGTGTIKLRATVPNTEHALWPGQFVNVRLILNIEKDAKLIPNEAMQIGQQGPFVFIVASDGTAEQRNITPGQRQGDLLVVEKGLQGDEAIVRSGQMMLNAGAHVIVQPSTPQLTAGAPGAGLGS